MVGAEVVMDRDVNGIGRLVCRVGEKVFMDRSVFGTLDIIC